MRFIGCLLSGALALLLTGCGGVLTNTGTVPVSPETEMAPISDQPLVLQIHMTQTNNNHVKSCPEVRKPHTHKAFKGTWVLSTLDLETGATKAFKSYIIPKLRGGDYYVSAYGYKEARDMFSPDYTKLAATKRYDDGRTHAGWLDTTGNFTDVTELLGQDGGESSAYSVNYRAVGFDRHGNFVYCVPDSDVINADWASISWGEMLERGRFCLPTYYQVETANIEPGKEVVSNYAEPLYAWYDFVATHTPIAENDQERVDFDSGEPLDWSREGNMVLEITDTRLLNPKTTGERYTEHNFAVVDMASQTIEEYLAIPDEIALGGVLNADGSKLALLTVDDYSDKASRLYSVDVDTIADNSSDNVDDGAGVQTIQISAAPLQTDVTFSSNQLPAMNTEDNRTILLGWTGANYGVAA